MKTMEMVKIVDCSVTECAYNSNKECHTLAITVGSNCPMCETYTSAKSKGGMDDVTGGVGACRMSDFRYNNMLECNASGIHVSKHSGHADCDTFEVK